MSALAAGVGSAHGEPGRKDTPEAREDLVRAFHQFASCAGRLQNAFAELQEEIRSLAAELEEKNRVIEALERQAARNERIAAMGEMAQRIAHQIRNPLGTIALYASILGREIADEALRAPVDRIAAAVRSADLVVQNLLAFADDLDPCLAPADLHGLLREIAQDAAGILGGRRIRVELRLEAVSDRVQVDKDLLRQAVLNLIANAAQAIADGGTVSVATSDRTLAGNGSAWIAISVFDKGAGIAAADLERIFDPLFTTRPGAAGLGLAIVQRVAEAHGGLVEVESELGRGSTFRLSLPLLEGSPDGAAASPPEP